MNEFIFNKEDIIKKLSARLNCYKIQLLQHDLDNENYEFLDNLIEKLTDFIFEESEKINNKKPIQ